MPPPLQTICLVIAVFLATLEFGNAQTNPSSHPKKQHPETYQVGNVEYRKSDNIVVSINAMNEKAAGKTPEEVAVNYLQSNKARFGVAGDLTDNLQHYFTWKGQGTTVVRFQQRYQHLPVDNNEAVVVLNHENRIVAVSNSFRPIKKTVDLTTAISKAEAELAVMAWFRLVKKPDNPRIEKVIHFNNDNMPTLCYKISFVIHQPSFGDWSFFLDARSGAVVDAADNLHHFQLGPSGAGSGNVFDPDPISTSGATYGLGGFKHDNNTNNSSLESQLKSVIFPIGDQFNPAPSWLRGERAYDDISFCSSSTADWSYNRSHQCFEEVICYYHIDKNMAYYYSFGGPQPQQNVQLPSPSAVRFQVTDGESSQSPAAYSTTEGLLFFSKYLNEETNQTIEAAEDAAVIIHELGHGVNDWMTGGNGNISGAEGLGEGFADYWAQSYIRGLGLWKEFEEEYQWVSRWFMFTDELPDEWDRTTDVEIADYGDIASLGSGHKQGQVFSTVMMKIYDDIGRYKSDLIALNGMAMTTSLFDQSDAAERIYQAAINAFNVGLLTQVDLCIVYEHFKDTYDNQFTSSAPNSSGDYYVRDTPNDFGAEPNTDNSAPIWASGDIWVRKQDDGLDIREIENPVYGQTNYIYVRVRSRGCTGVSDAQLYVYFSKASTALLWPLHWINYYEQTSGGPVLAGDLVSGAPIALPNDMKAGEERIFKIPWTNVPNPEDFDTEKHHFCLLARIVSQQDPMHTPEVPQLWINVRDNNNVAWKNFEILEKPPAIGPITASGSIFLRQTESTAANVSIEVTTPVVGRNVPCESQGDLHLRLGGGLHALWQNGGGLGAGFSLENDGRLKLLEANASIEGLSLTPGVSYFLEVYFEPDSNAQGCLLDVAQLNYLHQEIGGERFEYDPDNWESGGRERSNIAMPPRNSVNLMVYPSPTSGLLNVQINSGQDILDVSLLVYDSYGRLQLRRSVAVRRESSLVTLEISSFAAGPYFLELQDNEGHKLSSTRFIKF